MLRDSIGHLSRRLRQARAGVAGDLTFAESAALSTLIRNGPATSAELARSQGISPQSAGVTLKSLERAGLVDRAADPEDGRRVVLAASPAGERLYRARMDDRSGQFADALAREFTADELEQLVAAAPLLDRLGDRIATSALGLPRDAGRLARDVDHTDLLERSSA